jgi:hypothetical protein
MILQRHATTVRGIRQQEGGVDDLKFGHYTDLICVGDSGCTTMRGMTNALLLCDGCGQVADSAHIARRLRRLAWATRFRPIHIQALLLAGIAPRLDGDFLYSPEGSLGGEAASLLQALQLSAEGKSRQVLAEFQKLGLMLAHVLQCPLEEGVSESQGRALIEKQLPAAMARIRRSLKPKRVLVVSPELAAFSRKLHEAELGCAILPRGGGVFLGSAALVEDDFASFRTALGVSSVRAG